jgi:alpha-tubulin suppressor-like RCC1 family protein
VSGRQGAYTLAITTDGDLWACGGNAYGALGDNPVANAFFESLTQIPGKWKDIAASHYYDTSLGIKTDGTLWGTGYNGFGQLGLGHQNNVYEWTKLNDRTDWNIIECTHFGSFAVTTGGALYYTGLTYGGCFGNGKESQTVKTWTENASILVSKMSGGYDYMVVQNTEGDLYAAGYNGDGQFGIGNKTTYSVFTSMGISNPISFCAGLNGGNTNQGVTFVIKSDSSLWAAGSNAYTIMGTGDTTDKISFTDTGMTGCKKVVSKENSVLMIKTDGSLYGCGRNVNGELGLGHDDPVTTFTSVSALAWNLWTCCKASLITASIEVAEEVAAFPTTDCPEFDETDPYEVSELINC